MNKSKIQLKPMSTDPKAVSNIINAARRLNTVIIVYMDASGVITQRLTEPYEIKDGKYWGFCLERNNMRQFSLGNIISAEMTGTKFNPRFPVRF